MINATLACGRLVGLLGPSARKSIEPMAALVAEGRGRAGGDGSTRVRGRNRNWSAPWPSGSCGTASRGAPAQRGRLMADFAALRVRAGEGSANLAGWKTPGEPL